MVKGRLDHRGPRETQEHQEPTALRDRLVELDLEAEHLNDPRRVRGASTLRETVVAPMTGHEAPDEVLATMTTTTTPCQALER